MGSMWSWLTRTLALVFVVLGLGSLGAMAQTGDAQQQQAAEARFGFVIGNDGYDNAELPTAANDAALVADALRTAGFDVTGARNLDQDTLRASYREFLGKVSAAGPSAVAAIYISGYGLQFEGENYIVPVGASIQRVSDIGFNAIRLSDLTRPLAGLQGRGTIVMLDLAYKPPFLPEGLAPGLSLIEPEANMLVSYNAAPGMVAPAGAPPYGAYAQAVAEMIRLGGITANEVFDRVRLRVAELSRNAQMPWSASRISDPIVLLERAPNAPTEQVAQEIVDELDTAPIAKLDAKKAYAAAVKRDTVKDYQAFAEAYPDAPQTRNVRGMLASRREAITWQRTLSTNTPNAYWSYLKRYPRGPHAADARRRLSRLQAAAEPPPVFDAIEYDVPPPPPEEDIFFAGPGPVYLEPAPVEVVEYVRPPRWWSPPPPPVFADDDDYFLPAPPPVMPVPDWIAPPSYVAAPIDPYVDRPSLSGIAPYVAIPAALAAGIAVGKLISRNKNKSFPQNAGIAPAPIRPVNMPPTTLQPGQTHGKPFNTAFGAQRPPVAPSPVNVRPTAPSPLTSSPVRPVSPVAPSPQAVRPPSPVSPTAPGVPSAVQQQPTRPTTLPSPVQPTQQAAPTRPTTLPSPVQPAQRTAPTQPTTLPSPVQPAQRTAPTQPTTLPSPVQPTQQAVPTRPTTPPSPVQPAQQAAPTRPTTLPSPVQPAQQAAPTRPTTLPSPVQPAQQAAPTRPTTPPSPVQPAQQTAPTRPASPTAAPAPVMSQQQLQQQQLQQQRAAQQQAAQQRAAQAQQAAQQAAQQRAAQAQQAAQQRAAQAQQAAQQRAAQAQQKAAQAAQQRAAQAQQAAQQRAAQQAAQQRAAQAAQQAAQQRAAQAAQQRAAAAAAQQRAAAAAQQRAAAMAAQQRAAQAAAQQRAAAMAAQQRAAAMAAQQRAAQAAAAQRAAAAAAAAQRARCVPAPGRPCR